MLQSVGYLYNKSMNITQEIWYLLHFPFSSPAFFRNKHWSSSNVDRHLDICSVWGLND
jgi:hypothetical protein